MTGGWFAFGFLIGFFIAKECWLRWVMRRESARRARQRREP